MLKSATLYFWNSVNTGVGISVGWTARSGTAGSKGASVCYLENKTETSACYCCQIAFYKTSSMVQTHCQYVKCSICQLPHGWNVVQLLNLSFLQEEEKAVVCLHSLLFLWMRLSVFTQWKASFVSDAITFLLGCIFLSISRNSLYLHFWHELWTCFPSL